MKNKNKTTGKGAKESKELMQKVIGELLLTNEKDLEWEVVDLDEEVKKAICQKKKESKKK